MGLIFGNKSESMQLAEPLAIPPLAADLSLEIIGDSALMIQGINEIHKVIPGDLTYCDHPKYYPKAAGLRRAF